MNVNRAALFLLTILTAAVLSQVYAQTDSVYQEKKKFKWIAPAVLITTGTLTMLNTDADEFFLSNYEIREERNENFLNFSNHADNYLQYAPAAAALLMSVSGVEGKHTLPNQIALLVKSELMMSAVVYSLKYTVGEARPDSGKKNSFPSGHTAQAFAAATFLAKEYGHKGVWISIGAYTTATTVGVFRMLNNRHWISDVMVGAGVGILCTEFVYFTHKNRWGKKQKVSVTPFSASGSQGLTLRYVFR